MENYKRALWIGRFQPPTIGHIIATLAILSRWKKLTIGIVKDSECPQNIDAKWIKYLKEHAGTVESISKNPFKANEVINMWICILKEYSLEDRVELTSMPRVAYQEKFNQNFLPSKYDIVDIELSDPDPKKDYLRQKAFRIALKRKIFYVKVPLKIHVTQIKNMVHTNKGSWKEFLSKNEYEYFVKISGPQRINM